MNTLFREKTFNNAVDYEICFFLLVIATPYQNVYRMGKKKYLKLNMGQWTVKKWHVL